MNLKTLLDWLKSHNWVRRNNNTFTQFVGVVPPGNQSTIWCCYPKIEIQRDRCLFSWFQWDRNALEWTIIKEDVRNMDRAINVLVWFADRIR